MTIDRPAVGDPITASWGDAIVDAVASDYLGDASGASVVTLATAATYFAASASVTFTLATTRRVRIVGTVQFLSASATAGQYYAIAAYNPGSSASPGSSTSVGVIGAAMLNASGFRASAVGDGTALLTAGTYTAYIQAQRASGGNAGDSLRSTQIAVYDVGAS